MSEIQTIVGSTVTLRAIKESDIDDRLAIGKHNEFSHMCGGNSLHTPQYPNRSRWEEWYRTHKEKEKTEHTWIIDLNGKCIGSAVLHHLSMADRSARYAIGIFDPALHSRGIGSEVTKLILKYGFEELLLHRIDLMVLEYNKRGIRCYEKCGFKQDGILRDSAFIDGQFYSDIVMSILDDEWQN